MEGLRIYTLGGLRVQRDKAIVPISRQRAQALLAYLVAERRPHPREMLASLLAGEGAGGPAARKHLRYALWVLRRALGEAARLFVALIPPCGMMGSWPLWHFGGGVVPEISRFFGIIIRMFYSDHEPPHFHAIYGDHEALVEIETLAVFRGALPRRALALVLEWAALHRGELREDWRRARAGEPLHSVEPLD